MGVLMKSLCPLAFSLLAGDCEAIAAWVAG